MSKSEKAPLLGFSTQTYASTVAPAVSNSFAEPGQKVSGLLAVPEDKETEPEVCWGYDQKIIKILARLPFLHTFTALSVFVYFGHIWLLMLHPTIAVGIIATLVLYGVVRFWIMWTSAFYGLAVISKFDSRDPNYWQRQRRPPTAATIEFNSVWHAIIVPNYKEPIDKLRQTLDTIADQSIAKQIVVCMAMEARDTQGEETAKQLEREYGPRLGGYCYALHPLIPGETAGKSSNENWAARCIKKKMVDEMRISPDSVIITTCDADTFFHPNYFAATTYYFICDGDNRFHRFYLPVTNFMPNVFQVPAICNTRYTVLSVGRLSELANPLSKPFPLAIYSISLRLADDASYWDPTVVPEDWHMYFRCVFADKGRVEATKVMLTVGTEAVEGKGYMDTIKETYDQSVRWQWGAIDMGYLLVQTASRWEVPLWKRASILIAAYDHHLFAVTMGICLMTAPFLYGKIPVLVETDIWTGATALIIVKTLMIWVWMFHMVTHFVFLCVSDHYLRNGVLKDRMYFDIDHPHAKGPMRWLSLLMFPVADVFLFLIPTMHAHAKMFWSPEFNYVPSAKMGAKRTCPSPADMCGGGNLGVDERA